MNPPLGAQVIFAKDLFRSRCAVVTGGGTGIGLAIARELGELGARVVLAARTIDRLEAAAAALRAEGIETLALGLNVRDASAVERFYAELDERSALPDILVNNAGGQFVSAALAISPNGFRAVTDLNLQGTWLMAQGFARRRIAAGGGGCIINIVLSVAGATPGMAHAGAARAAVIHLTQTLAVEWAPYGLRVNAIAPGTVGTHGLDRYDPAEIARGLARLPIPRMGEPREIAVAAAYLASPAAGLITGVMLPVDGGRHLVGPPPIKASPGS